MTKFISTLVPQAEDLLSLSPEELAGVMLEYFNSLSDGEQRAILNRNVITHPGQLQAIQYPEPYRTKIAEAFMEAWVWLEREGLIAPRPGEPGEWAFVTKRGKHVKNRDGLASYRHADLLPRKLLHPRIATTVWAPFIRGEYPAAVFQAFVELEVAVRDASSLADAETHIGQKLMRAAFHIEKGPLTDKTIHEGERQALSDLFAGAIGAYKNPTSHRHVSIDCTDAVEMIMLASHLLKIVDSRRKIRPT